MKKTHPFFGPILVCILFLALYNVAPAKERAPNIIYILLDDAGWGDLSCYGQEKFQTPHVDQLAKEGMRFTQHYSGSTVCAPSRCSLMTGLHTGHCSIRGNKEHHPHGQSPMPAEDLTIAELLKQAGYTTGCFGKWGLGFIGSEGDANAQGFDHFFGYNCQRWAHEYYRPWLDDNRERVETGGAYSGELIQRKALDFIRDNQAKPFFLYYAMTIPHAQMQVPEAYYARVQSRYPDIPETDPEKRKKIIAFPAMMTYMDEQVGELMRLLQELELDSHTLVLFSSDNGPHQEGGHTPEFWNSNGPFRGLKRSLYEGGIRAPFIARWPGKIKKGTNSDLLSAHWDIFPTLCDVAGINTPDHIDGLSMLPTLLGKDQQQKHPYLYWEFYEQGGRQAVRMGAWKAVRNNILADPQAPVELYNLRNDPSESHNIASQHPDVVSKAIHYFQEAHIPNEHYQIK